MQSLQILNSSAKCLIQASNGASKSERGYSAEPVVRGVGQAGEHSGGQGGVEAGVTAPHIGGLRVARDGAHVAENRKYRSCLLLLSVLIIV